LRLLRGVTGLILLPFSLTMAWTFLRTASRLPWGEKPLLAFALGFLSYLAVHAVLYKPIFMHVMGHELTHAFWAFLFGGDVKSLHVSPEGGKVILNRSNFLITLAPYFFPLYTFLLIPVYAISKESFVPLIVFLLGASVAFHIVLTVHSIWLSQSDIKSCGTVFSLTFVLMVNLLVFIGLLATVAPAQFHLGDFCSDYGGDLLREGKWCWAVIRGAKG